MGRERKRAYFKNLSKIMVNRLYKILEATSDCISSIKDSSFRIFEKIIKNDNRKIEELNKIYKILGIIAIELFILIVISL
jgi:hypothetical protein